jgi:hypothetical protein
MTEWLEELKVQRSKQACNDPYQQYQAYLDEIDEMGSVVSIGEMQGKKFKNLTSDDAKLVSFFNNIIK